MTVKMKKCENISKSTFVLICNIIYKNPCIVGKIIYGSLKQKRD